jgi:hypothetical protein
MPLDYVRMCQIVNESKSRSKYGPWSDQLNKVMTKSEYDEVLKLWSTMPGSTCFMDAFNRLMKECEVASKSQKIMISR